jgi:hypothetical protein
LATSQAEQVQQLYRDVPVSHTKHWESEEGRAFIAYLCDLRERGIPVAWVAETIGLPPQHLYGLLARYRDDAEIQARVVSA